MKTYLRRPRGHRLDGTLLRDTRKFTKRGDLRSLNLALRKSRKSWWHTSRAMEVSRGAPTRRGCRPWNLRPPIIRKSLFSFKRAAKNPTETGPPLPSDSHTNLSRSPSAALAFSTGGMQAFSFSACHLQPCTLLFFRKRHFTLQTAFHSLERHLQLQKFRSHFFQWPVQTYARANRSFSGGSADGAAAEVAGGHRKHVFEGAREVALVLETDHVANIGHRQLLLGSEKFLRLLETTARDVAPR